MVQPGSKPILMAPDDSQALSEAERFWATEAKHNVSPVFSLYVPLQVTLPFKNIKVTAEVRLLGLKVERFLICELPSHQGTSLGGTGVNCDVRYMLHGRIVGFTAQVLKTQFSPEPLMFLSFPKTVSEVALRRQERVRVNLEAVARLKGSATRYSGVIRDLSSGGCGFFIPEDLDIGVGTELTIYVKFPREDVLRKVQATVRGVRRPKQTKGVVLGLSFAFDAEDLPVKNEIENLVTVRSGVGSSDLIV